jgi:hypothetical protein
METRAALQVAVAQVVALLRRIQAVTKEAVNGQDMAAETDSMRNKCLAELR